MNDISNYVSYSYNGSKCVAAVVLGIKSIPHFKILGENEEETVAKVRQIFTIIINDFSLLKNDPSISLELVWSCSPAVNQSFSSYVDISLVLRAVESSYELCLDTINRAMKLIVDGLNGIKAVIEYRPFDFYQNIVNEIGDSCVLSVRRPDDVMSFTFPAVTQCYKYDCVSQNNNDIDALINSLIKGNESTILIQLIPSRYSDAEKYYISNTLNLLGRISQGIPVPRAGLYRDMRAEVPLRTYKKYFEYLNSPMLSMGVFVCGERRNAANIATRIMSMLKTNTDGQEGTFVVEDVSQIRQSLSQVYVSPWLTFDFLQSFNRQKIFLNPSVARLAYLYTPNEVSQIFRIPIGTQKITAGIPIHEIEKRNKKFVDGIINTADFSIGRLQNIIGSQEPYIGINRNDLTKHMLVVGTPGSGKSTFLVGLMDRIWKHAHIPFLVIEPAKNEYRALIDSIPELQIFSPGKNDIAPFVLNPFVPPKGVTIEKYKSIVKSAFAAAFEMWTPLDQLFDETLNICYSEQGWLDSDTVDNVSECFSLIDFIQVYKEVVSQKGYSGEYKKQVEAAGVLRLNGLLEQNVNVFDSRFSVPVEDILSKPTVIELASIRDVKQKSFIIALLLNNIYAYVEGNNANDGALKNVILLEEAHALLCGEAATSQSGDNAANAAAVKMLTDMLAEIRSRGVGIVIADQSPKKVTSQVIANTNVKLAFRLVEADDKEIIKRSTAMTDLQLDRLAKMRTGQALLFFDKLDEVEEVLMDDYRLNHGITTDLSDEAIKQKMTYWTTHARLLMPYADCDCIEYCAEGCSVKIKEQARIVADRLFRKSYHKDFNDFESFAKFYKTISQAITTEYKTIFRSDSIDKRLLCCAKVHFLRKVHYYTDIAIPFEKRKKTYELTKK